MILPIWASWVGGQSLCHVDTVGWLKKSWQCREHRGDCAQCARPSVQPSPLHAVGEGQQHVETM